MTDDIEALVKRLDELCHGVGTTAVESSWWSDEADRILPEAAAKLRSLKAERDEYLAERDTMERQWRTMAERDSTLRSRLTEMEGALRDMADYFTDPLQDTELRDEDFWEGSYKGNPSQEYIDYWKVVDRARALLSPKSDGVTFRCVHGTPACSRCGSVTALSPKSEVGE